MTTTPEAPASTAAAMDALHQRLSQRFIALDPSGYFLIKLDRDVAVLVLEHYGNTSPVSESRANPFSSMVLP